jgi:hypothetical protein
MTNYWLIENDAKSHRVGDRLNNLQIQELSTGYQLVAVGVLCTTAKQPIEFKNITWQGHTWDISVRQPLVPGENTKGKWHKHGDEPGDTGPEDGDFTAQAGSGLGEEPVKAASSAKA